MADALGVMEVAENVFVFTLGGEGVADSFGANCTAVVGGDLVLLVDPLIAPSHARLVEEAVRRRTKKPIRYVALTHHHTDHALGSSWFSRQGATLIASSICRERMAAEHPALIAKRREIPELKALFSDVEFGVAGPTLEPPLTLDLGNFEVDVQVRGPGHTPGDLVILLPATSVVVCGDLVSNGYHVNYEDAAIDLFARRLEELLALKAAIYVPGHGAPGDRRIVDQQLENFAVFRDVVAAGGNRSSEALAEEIAGRFPGYLLEVVLPDAVEAFRRALPAS